MFKNFISLIKFVAFAALFGCVTTVAPKINSVSNFTLYRGPIEVVLVKVQPAFDSLQEYQLSVRNLGDKYTKVESIHLGVDFAGSGGVSFIEPLPYYPGESWKTYNSSFQARRLKFPLELQAQGKKDSFTGSLFLPGSFPKAKVFTVYFLDYRYDRARGTTAQFRRGIITKVLPERSE